MMKSAVLVLHAFFVLLEFDGFCLKFFIIFLVTSLENVPARKLFQVMISDLTSTFQKREEKSLPRLYTEYTA